MNSKIKDKSVGLFLQAVLSFKTVEECYGFFEDLCTVPEIKAISQRPMVVHMLRSRCVYSDTVAKTGASTATISRVSRSLSCGCDGHEIVFKRPEESGDTGQ